MIRELHLENFLFIRDSSLEFSPGLNVITGETGAGKSILLEAVKLLLGKKGKSGLALPGSPNARIQATFDISRVPQAQRYLADAGFIEEDNPNQLCISRTFKAEGADKTLINGLLTTGASLKGLGVFLMEIHGQNEHQTLLEPKVQRRLLDRLGGEGHQKKLVHLSKKYQEKRQAQEELAELEQHLRDGESRLEELADLQNALETLALTSAEEEFELKTEADRLAHSEQIAEAINSCHESLAGDGETDGVVSRLFRAKESLGRILAFDDRWQPFCERLESMYNEAVDLQSDVTKQGADDDFDPGRLAFLQSRLADINRACRRYRTDCAGLFNLKDQVRKEIGELTSPDSALEKKRACLSEIDGEFSRLCREVAGERKKLAASLEKLVMAEMMHLGFAAARFSVALTPCAAGEEGSENVEYLVSLNPGVPGGPLRRIASGGELSRVALALKKVLASGDEMPTMVFDEIDSGIGGETAGAVALSLKKLGKEKQVILVTHLHQIAKEGERHFTVGKQVENGTTRVEIRPVADKDREKEVARMLGATGDDGLTFARSILQEKKSGKGKTKTKAKNSASA